jgi:hypothetical protein
MLKTILGVLLVLVVIGILIGLCLGEADDEELEIDVTQIESVMSVS